MTDQTERLAQIRARVEAAVNDQQYTTGKYSTGEKCESCHGSGHFLNEACPDCFGTGLIWHLGKEPSDRADVSYLLDLVDSLTAERDAALHDTARVRDTQKDMGSLDDAVAAILRRYPDDPYADYLTSRLEDAVQPRKAELAQRDEELAALREKITAAQDWLREDESNCDDCHYAAQMVVAAANDGLIPMPGHAPSCDLHEGAHRFLAALSGGHDIPAIF